MGVERRCAWSYAWLGSCMLQVIFPGWVVGEVAVDI